MKVYFPLLIATLMWSDSFACVGAVQKPAPAVRRAKTCRQCMLDGMVCAKLPENPISAWVVRSPIATKPIIITPDQVSH